MTPETEKFRLALDMDDVEDVLEALALLRAAGLVTEDETVYRLRQSDISAHMGGVPMANTYLVRPQGTRPLADALLVTWKYA